MFASAAAFKDGSLSWRITHDAQQANDHLLIEGKPPEPLARIQTEQFARAGEDREVDFIFEIPVQLAEEVVGFRHDKESSASFEVLRVTSEQKPPKWKFW